MKIKILGSSLFILTCANAIFAGIGSPIVMDDFRAKYSKDGKTFSVRMGNRDIIVSSICLDFEHIYHPLKVGALIQNRED